MQCLLLIGHEEIMSICRKYLKRLLNARISVCNRYKEISTYDRSIPQKVQARASSIFSYQSYNLTEYVFLLFYTF